LEIVMLLQRLALRAAVACALLLASPPARAMEGIASTYGREIFRINPKGLTANGERFKPMGLTAAIWSLPFNTRVRVTHLATGRSIVVRVNDRGPHKRLGRLIDLSTGAARALGMGGLAHVRVDVVTVPGLDRSRVADAH